MNRLEIGLSKDPESYSKASQGTHTQQHTGSQKNLYQWKASDHIQNLARDCLPCQSEDGIFLTQTHAEPSRSTYKNCTKHHSRPELLESEL